MSNQSKILVLNLGSSSIKFALFDTDGARYDRLAAGVFEEIGRNSRVAYDCEGNKGELEQSFPSHEAGMYFLEELLTNKSYCHIIEDASEIDAIGHRVVHGGDEITRPSLIDDRVITVIEECEAFAPLHNPVNLRGIRIAAEVFPGKPQVAVFDTAFHATIPDSAKTYGLDRKYFHDGIKKYGFHGTSHHYVTLEAARMLGVAPDEVNLITCHLGNGSSIAAVEKGKSIETSMGFTPLEGLMMGTRSGDMDPAAILYVMKNEGLTPDETETWLNKKSGMYALAGIESSDMRQIWDAADAGNQQATLALEAFAHRVGKYIGACSWHLKGNYDLVFTGGIGENDWRMRELILQGHEASGIILDTQANRSNESVITTPDSPRKALVIHTDEELMIARSTYDTVKV